VRQSGKKESVLPALVDDGVPVAPMPPAEPKKTDVN